MAIKNLPRFLNGSWDDFDYEQSLTDSEIQYVQPIFNALKLDGLAVLPNFFDARLMDNVVEQTRGRYVKGRRYKNENNRVINAFMESEAVASLACDSKMIKILKEVWGAEPFAFQTLNFDKGTEQPLHSDDIHFSSSPKNFMAGVWVALEDITESQGPLVYVKGSHLLPFFHRGFWYSGCAALRPISILSPV